MVPDQLRNRPLVERMKHIAKLFLANATLSEGRTVVPTQRADESIPVFPANVCSDPSAEHASSSMAACVGFQRRSHTAAAALPGVGG